MKLPDCPPGLTHDKLRQRMGQLWKELRTRELATATSAAAVRVPAAAAAAAAVRVPKVNTGHLPFSVQYYPKVDADAKQHVPDLLQL
eukprot:COSAG05_NODE_23234_length_259_cov_0.650000_1_plen_86_part_11